MTWKYFCGACILGGALALKAGAPLIAVIVGIGLAALWSNKKIRRETT